MTKWNLRKQKWLWLNLSRKYNSVCLGGQVNGRTNKSSCSPLRTAFSECPKCETDMLHTAWLSVTYFHIFLYYMHQHFKFFVNIDLILAF